MFETVTCGKNLQGLEIEKVDKVTLHTTAKDKVGREVKIQIDITNCKDPEISIDVWEELNRQTMSKETKNKLSFTCQDFNMEIKKDNGRDNLLTYLWRSCKGE